jgi:hypothetical protein
MQKKNTYYTRDHPIQRSNLFNNNEFKKKLFASINAARRLE